MNRDVQGSRIRISRRRALRAGGAIGLGALVAATGTCTLTPEETEGPYHLDLDDVRRDIREDRPGALLRLALRVQDVTDCAPVPNALVEIWHCDAGGIYSGFEAASTGAGGQPGRNSGATDGTYLRGSQVTDADGIVDFLTIYPGWYRGRTVHIHFKVHVGSTTMPTSQLYFDEAVTDTVYAGAPHSGHPGRDTPDTDDRIFDSNLVLTTSRTTDGYLALMNVGIDVRDGSVTSRDVSN
ncbi:intradiol ring-cleavage dioxygenase [Pseudonocardia sp. H11422]|uniref:intradiol ring-cleavage dioxygenase n=1 Tax=Pseudonocardia sp. H11422 TaxID=2835866 RepID=UPI001BDD2B0C|nr:intradiol ring-cleavage dioxygenase [Pseudonocardia sp. H11422]